MRIISKKQIRVYSEKNQQAKLPLVEWYLKMLVAIPKNFSELKKIFNSVDYTNGYTIFDIGGNNYRLITALHYNSKICYIREIWTHADYIKPHNQAKLNRGML